MKLTMIAISALLTVSTVWGASCSPVYNKIKSQCDVSFGAGMHSRIKSSSNICQQVGRVQFINRVNHDKLYVIDLNDCSYKSKRQKSFKVYDTAGTTTGYVPQLKKYLIIEDGQVFALGSRDSDITLFEIMNTSGRSYSTITGAAYSNNNLVLKRGSQNYRIPYQDLKVGKRLRIVSKHEKRASKAGERAMKDMGINID